MAPRPIQRALISVYDKTGIVDFARALVTEFGIEIISTGGTAAHLKENGVPVTLVEDITGFPELLDGRVKTLHPKIHAAILADRDNTEHMRQLAAQGIKPIDMVVVNLYPFEKTVADPKCTFEQAIEMIDIGGPCLLRAAAKNHKHVIAVPSVKLYQTILLRLKAGDGTGIDDLHNSGADWTFAETARYDGAVAEWIGATHSTDGSPMWRFLEYFNWGPLRYGENPHQQAEFWSLSSDPRAASLQCPVSSTSPPPSYNNLLDASSALELIEELSRLSPPADPNPCCVFIKHNNACGVGIATDPIEAYRRAYLGDPNAAMGGILAVNFRVDAEFSEAVMETLARWGKPAGASAFFLEVWIAPDFTDDDVVVGVIQSRKPWGKNVRLLDTGRNEDACNGRGSDLRSVVGGVLTQQRDRLGLNEEQWKVVTKRPPTDAELADLRLAWLVAKHTKSNAISVCKDGMLIGNGAGQMSRVMSCRIATWLANENGHADKLKGAAAASDAFFPFADGPKLLVDAGVTAIIQPGGSKRDEEVIKACDERGVAMIFTGTRHFRH